MTVNVCCIGVEALIDAYLMRFQSSRAGRILV